MRLLDLYCGAGGAAMGYHLAGFEVVGVDIEPQPNYPFKFRRAHALDFPLDGFDVVHASPPCQRYINGGTVAKHRHPDLLALTREALMEYGIPWVIENVPGAPMRADVLLCGSMFGLSVRRHRLFELSTGTPTMTLCCDHSRQIAGVYGHPHGDRGAWPGMLSGDRETWGAAMGIDWMTAPELADAIPPAYTEFVGAQMLVELGLVELDLRNLVPDGDRSVYGETGLGAPGRLERPQAATAGGG